MSNNHSHNGTYLILGALVGIIIGILYAPKKGKETRDMLKKAVDEHQETLDTAKEGAEDIINKTKNQIETLIDNVSKNIDEKINKKKDTED